MGIRHAVIRVLLVLDWRMADIGAAGRTLYSDLPQWRSGVTECVTVMRGAIGVQLHTRGCSPHASSTQQRRDRHQ
jgi:hypothetical protein